MKSLFGGGWRIGPPVFSIQEAEFFYSQGAPYLFIFYGNFSCFLTEAVWSFFLLK